jgi:hypothetical protein
VTVLLGQTIRQPPAALIYSAPKKSEIKTFVSTDSGFSIDFSGAPDISARELQFGTVTKFNVKRIGSNAVVKVYDINPRSSGILDAEKVFQLFKADYLAWPGAKLAGENDFKLETFAGREYSIIAGIDFYKFRVLVRENKVYEIYISATNWQILNDSAKDAKKEFETETDRFFNSFKFTK